MTKYLSHYTEPHINEAMEKAGAFWAFGQKQFDERKDEGVEYVSLGGGLVSEKDKASQLIEDMDNAIMLGRQEDLRENGIEKIILRELNNYECFYTGDITEAVESLSGYKELMAVDEKTIMTVFNANAHKYDY